MKKRQSLLLGLGAQGYIPCNQTTIGISSIYLLPRNTLPSLPRYDARHGAVRVPVKDMYAETRWLKLASLFKGDVAQSSHEAHPLSSNLVSIQSWFMFLTPTVLYSPATGQ